MKPQMQTEISSEGLTKALLEAAEAEQHKQDDLRVIVWCHLLRWYLGNPDDTMPRHMFYSKTYMFKVMNTGISRWYVEQGCKTHRTDEVPTQWMRDLYQEFVDWRDTGIGVSKDFKFDDSCAIKSREQGGEKIKNGKRQKKRTAKN